MSSYRNQTLGMTAVAGAAVCSYLGADVVDMALVAQARDQLDTATTDLAAADLVGRLDSEVLRTLEIVAPVTWPALGDALSTGAVESVDLARDAFAEADRAFGVATRSVLLDTVLEFTQLESEGFSTVLTNVGEHAAAVFATRADSDEQVMFLVDDAGTVQQEYAGHSGTSCEERAAAFKRHAEQRGIHLTLTEHVPVHDGREDGDRLILDAVRTNRVNPAAGAVQNVEGGSAAPTSRGRTGIFAEAEETARTTVRTQVGGMA